LIGGCTCAVYGWGRVPSPICPVHCRNRTGGKTIMRVVREPGHVDQAAAMRDDIQAHEELLLAMMREHRTTCGLCHDRDELWVTCRLGEVLRGAWFNAFRLLQQPTTWSLVETVRPFSLGGAS
jgi:hypothetical protein